MTKSFLLNDDGRVIVYSDIDAGTRREMDALVDQAALYAQAAGTNAGYYDSIALGLAAVADGGTFGVVAGGVDDLARATLLRRDSASTYTEIVDLASGAEVTDRAEDAEAAKTDAETARDQAEAWSQSPTAPDPLDPTSKSAMTWAGEAEDAADRSDLSAAQAALYDGPRRITVPQLLADTALTYTPGSPSSVAAGASVRVDTGAFAYRVAPADATDHDVITAGGVKLYVQPNADGQISFMQFGAAGDGDPNAGTGADDSAAIKAALVWISAKRTQASSPTSATFSRVNLGGRWFRFEDATPATLPAFCEIDFAGGGIFSTGDTANFFSETTSSLRTVMRNGTLLGGAKQVALASEGQNSHVAIFDAMTFINYADVAIGQRTGQAAITNGLNIQIGSGCKFRTNVSTARHLDLRADLVTINSGVWFEGNNDEWIVNQASNLIISDALTVSDARPGPGPACFVKNMAGNVFIDRVRHGPENNGLDLIHNYVSANWAAAETSGNARRIISITDGSLEFTDSNYLIRFFGLPSQIIIENNRMRGNPLGIYVDDAVPANDIAYFGYRGEYVERGNGRGIPIVGSPAVVQSLIRNQNATPDWATVIRVPDVVKTVEASAMTLSTNSNVTRSTDSLGLGGGTRRTTTATADNGSNAIIDSAFLTGVPNGLYTALALIENAGTSKASVALSVGNFSRGYDVYPGLHLLPVRIYHSGGARVQGQFQVSRIASGDMVALQGLRLVKGWPQIAGPALTMWGDAIPADRRWWAGDRIVNSAPAAGAWPEAVCTANGTPGTWASPRWPLSGSKAYDPPSLADGDVDTTTVTVTGAALGDYATASFSLDLQGVDLTAWVSAANTVTCRFSNRTGGTVDLGSGTLRAKVIAA